MLISVTGSEKQSGSSVHDGSVKDRQSIASLDMLASKGLIAFRSGSKEVVTTQHTPTKDAAAKPVC